MNTTAQNAPFGECPPGPRTALLTGTLGTLRAVAQRIDAWLKIRERVAADHDALAGMSERELADIGLSRASSSFVARGANVRDYPF